MAKSPIVRRFAPSPVVGSLGLVLLLGSCWAIWSIVDWAIIRAIFSVGGRAMCHEPNAGACWSVVANRWRLILFGLYPYDEQWRSAVACGVMIAVIVCSCSPLFWTTWRLTTLWVSGFLTFYTLMRGGILGMSLVYPQQWGGLSLTLFVFASVVLIGMPLAVIFALLRKSSLPGISSTMIVIIDTIRGLPLLAVVFTFAVVLPFALPSWAAGDKLYRMIVGFALFFACYQAEVLRGGMQAIPPGQEEAAKALGLGYWHRIIYITLPQAFKNALPPTISQCVTTLKDTTLVVIVGFFEVLGSGGAAFGTSEWQFAYKEVYVFVGLIFFAFTFSLSRYGSYLERRLWTHS